MGAIIVTVKRQGITYLNWAHRNVEFIDILISLLCLEVWQVHAHFVPKVHKWKLYYTMIGFVRQKSS